MGQRYTFFFAAKEGRLSDLVWVLNQKNASPDMKDGESQSTALHMTCARGHTKCADLLIKAGAHVNCRTTEGMTPLHFATYGGHFGCVCILLAAKADVHAATRFGCTALHQAAFFNRLKCAEIIIKNGGGVNTQESWGLTPLSIAAQKGDREMLKLFLLNNALTDVQGKIDGKTPLHLTLEHNHKECVVILLDGGANPDIQDAEGRTALHYACSAHQVETIALILLEFGASPCIENKERERFAERLEKLQSKLISKEKKSEVLRKINEFVGERHFEIVDQDRYSNNVGF